MTYENLDTRQPCNCHRRRNASSKISPTTVFSKVSNVSVNNLMLELQNNLIGLITVIINELLESLININKFETFPLIHTQQLTNLGETKYSTQQIN